MVRRWGTNVRISSVIPTVRGHGSLSRGLAASESVVRRTWLLAGKGPSTLVWGNRAVSRKLSPSTIWRSGSLEGRVHSDSGADYVWVEPESAERRSDRVCQLLARFFSTDDPPH